MIYRSLPDDLFTGLKLELDVWRHACAQPTECLLEFIIMTLMKYQMLILLLSALGFMS